MSYSLDEDELDEDELDEDEANEDGVEGTEVHVQYNKLPFVKRGDAADVLSGEFSLKIPSF